MFVVFGKGKVGTAVVELLKFLGKEWCLMDDTDRNQEILTQAQQIIVSPGVPQYHKIYQQFGIKVGGELDFIAQISQERQLETIEYIGITGTNGKSTTTWIVYNILSQLFQSETTKVVLSGNFGTPISQVILEQLKNPVPKLVMILEVSSFMLYRCKKFQFDWSIITNIARDHLDWHKDMQEYRDTKIQILENTKYQGFVLQEIYNTLSPKLQSKTTVFDTNYDLKNTQFLGKHNQANFSAAIKLLEIYIDNKKSSVDKEQISNMISTINPLAHRMFPLKKIDNVMIYDDGICTSAHALYGALSCFDEKILLIAGGYDKGDDYSILIPMLKSKVAHSILIGQTGKEKLKAICEENSITYTLVEEFGSCLDIALQQAKKDNVKIILFSPGAASFDMFINVYDRCKQFENLVENLEDK